jgi:hypothetical protein
MTEAAHQETSGGDRVAIDPEHPAIPIEPDKPLYDNAALICFWCALR